MLANIRLVAILAFGLFVKLKLGRARALNIRARAKSGLGSIQELRARTLQKARKNVSGGLGLGLGPRPVPPLLDVTYSTLPTSTTFQDWSVNVLLVFVFT